MWVYFAGIIPLNIIYLLKRVQFYKKYIVAPFITLFNFGNLQQLHRVILNHFLLTNLEQVLQSTDWYL